MFCSFFPYFVAAGEIYSYTSSHSVGILYGVGTTLEQRPRHIYAKIKLCKTSSPPPHTPGFHHIYTHI